MPVGPQFTANKRMVVLVEGYEFIDEFGVSIMEKNRETEELNRSLRVQLRLESIHLRFPATWLVVFTLQVW